jgi:hypothetical protein
MADIYATGTVHTMEKIVSFGERGSINRLLPEGLTKAALVRYMRSCPGVLSARKLLPDRFDPNAKRISLTYSSDGFSYGPRRLRNISIATRCQYPRTSYDMWPNMWQIMVKRRARFLKRFEKQRESL